MLIPPFLAQGDKVGVVATAKKINAAFLKDGISVLSKWGLKPIVADNVYSGSKFLAGDDSARLDGWNQMISDPEIKCIFCGRGGYGTGRLIEKIDLRNFRQEPKWIIGFSDITLLHLKLLKHEIASIHGPMPAIFHKTKTNALEQLRRFLFTGEIEPLKGNSRYPFKSGSARGQIVGGNLSMICNSMGTPLEIETKGKILVIEEVGEPLYRIDRMMHQLKFAGKLSDLAGLVLGHFTIPNEDEAFDFTIAEIIDHLTKDFTYPVASNLSFGHEEDNYPIPLGVTGSLLVSENESKLEFELAAN